MPMKFISKFTTVFYSLRVYKYLQMNFVTFFHHRNYLYMEGKNMISCDAISAAS